MTRSIPIILAVLLTFLMIHWVSGGRMDFRFFGKEANAKVFLEDLPGDPELSGPDRICLVYGSVIEEFFGGGLPALDFYRWIITDPTGVELINIGGGAGLQTFPFTFSIVGEHTVELRVRRGGTTIFNASKKVQVIKGATPALKNSYALCPSQNLVLTAVDPGSQDISEMVFEWQDASGNPLGVNTNTFTVSNPGDYRVRYYFINSLGSPECENILSTTVTSAQDFSLNISSGNACPGDAITVSPNVPLFGEWSYEKDGNGVIKPFHIGTMLDFVPSEDLEGFGNYTIYLTYTNPDIAGCDIVRSVSLQYAPNASYDIIGVTPASSCLSNDGSIYIQAGTNLDIIYYVVNDSVNSPGVSMSAGGIYEFKNLSAGVYGFVGVLGNCQFKLAGVVPVSNIPNHLDYEILDIYDETCTDIGSKWGGFTVRFPNGPVDAEYQIFTEKGDIENKGIIENESELLIEMPGGKYYFEVFDKDDCTLSYETQIEIIGLPQVDLPIVDNFVICESYEFIPQSADDVSFTLIHPDGTEEDRLKGEAFLLQLAGEYSLVATHVSDPEICPYLRKFTVSLIPSIDFSVELSNQDCVGNQTYSITLSNITESEVSIHWYNELDEEIGTGMEMFPTSFGMYKVDVQPINSFACPTPPLQFEVNEPILQVDVNLSSTPLCPFGPGATIELSTLFSEVDRIEWIYYDQDDNQTLLTELLNDTIVAADVEGIYEAVVFNRFNCELGRDFIEIIESTDLTVFVVEDSYTVCETYPWIPETSQDLTFILTYPNGDQETRTSEETFELDQQGTYLIRGESSDPNNPVCPNEKSFDVIFVSPIDFTPEWVGQTCEGEFTYEADISGANPDDVLFTWTDDSGQVIGTEQFLVTSLPGLYALEVQPKGSLPCPITPIEFEIMPPVLSLGLQLTVGTLCPDATTAQMVLENETADTDLIEWWFTDFDGNRSQLNNLTGRKEIAVGNEGTYEVLVYNQFGCELGNTMTLLMRSLDAARPIVEENYLVCGELGVGPNINPGNFQNYSWFLEDELISTEAIFKPQIAGDYTLVVNSNEECEYTTSFVVEEVCDFQVSFPTGIKPGDPERNFLVYTNYLVDELEVWIFNRWGNLVYHCSNNGLISESSTCIWDGTYNGEWIPIGSYAVRINYKNYESNTSGTMIYFFS
jgi:hypothetical protein